MTQLQWREPMAVKGSHWAYSSFVVVKNYNGTTDVTLGIGKLGQDKCRATITLTPDEADSLALRLLRTAAEIRVRP